jgi:hypothetical protein
MTIDYYADATDLYAATMHKFGKKVNFSKIIAFLREQGDVVEIKVFCTFKGPIPAKFAAALRSNGATYQNCPAPERSSALTLAASKSKADMVMLSVTNSSYRALVASLKKDGKRTALLSSDPSPKLTPEISFDITGDMLT